MNKQVDRDGMKLEAERRETGPNESQELQDDQVERKREIQEQEEIKKDQEMVIPGDTGGDAESSTEPSEELDTITTDTFMKQTNKTRKKRGHCARH